MAHFVTHNMSEPVAEAYSSGSGGGAFSVNFGYPEGVKITDLVPEHIRHMVHPHWNNFPPVNPMWHYVLGIVYLFLGFVALFGNGTVLRLFFKNKNLRTPSNMLVANLAVSDLIMITTNFPFFTYNCFNGGVWNFSPLYCEIYAMLGSITGLCSIWSLVFISYDRYNVIVKGVSGARLTSGKAMIFMLFCWIYAIGWSIPPLVGWGKYIPEGILDSCSFDYFTQTDNVKSFAIAIFVFDYIIPLFVILFAYGFIVKAIFAHEAAMRAQAKKMNVSNLRSNQDANAQSAEVRIAKVAMTNVALWLVCWTPYAAVTLQGMFGDQSKVTPLVSSLPAFLAKSASVYNPVVYAINHPKFRQAIQKDMPWFCIHEPDTAKSETKSTESGETCAKEETA